MIYSRQHLEQLAADVRRLESEAADHQRRGNFVLAADKRVAADGIRAQLASIEDSRRRLSVRFA